MESLNNKIIIIKPITTQKIKMVFYRFYTVKNNLLNIVKLY